MAAAAAAVRFNPPLGPPDFGGCCPGDIPCIPICPGPIPPWPCGISPTPGGPEPTLPGPNPRCWTRCLSACTCISCGIWSILCESSWGTLRLVRTAMMFGIGIELGLPLPVAPIAPGGDIPGIGLGISGIPVAGKNAPMSPWFGTDANMTLLECTPEGKVQTAMMYC